MDDIKKEFADEIEEFATKQKDPQIYAIFHDLADAIRIRDEHINWMREVIPGYSSCLINIVDACNKQLNALNRALHMCTETLEEDTKYTKSLEDMFLDAKTGEYYFKGASRETRTSSLSELYDAAEKHALTQLNELRKKHGRSERDSK